MAKNISLLFYWYVQICVTYILEVKLNRPSVFSFFYLIEIQT